LLKVVNKQKLFEQIKYWIRDNSVPIVVAMIGTAIGIIIFGGDISAGTGRRH
jgi:hypothetical protein